uniref:Uncharacterized protein n=1 Tax=Alexandrium monilatum TaxID=311494 RepID=A0A7S4PVS9_9DINO
MRLVFLLTGFAAIAAAASTRVAEAPDAIALVQGPLAVAAPAADSPLPLAPGLPDATVQRAPRHRASDKAAVAVAGFSHNLASSLWAAWRTAGRDREAGFHRLMIIALTREGLRQAFFMLLVFGGVKGYALAIRPDRKAEEMLIGQAGPGHPPRLPRGPPAIPVP